MAALRLCGFAACAFHAGFAALRLERVYPNPRAMNLKMKSTYYYYYYHYYHYYYYY